MNSRLRGRVEKLEKVSRGAKEVVVYIQKFSEEGATNLPDPDEEIARQRAEGKTFIIVKFVAPQPRDCSCDAVYNG